MLWTVTNGRTRHTSFLAQPQTFKFVLSLQNNNGKLQVTHSFILAESFNSASTLWVILAGGKLSDFGFTFFLLLYSPVNSKNPLTDSYKVVVRCKGPSTRNSGTNWIWEGESCLKYRQVLSISNRSKSMRWD